MDIEKEKKIDRFIENISKTEFGIDGSVILDCKVVGNAICLYELIYNSMCSTHGFSIRCLDATLDDLIKEYGKREDEPKKTGFKSVTAIFKPSIVTHDFINKRCRRIFNLACRFMIEKLCEDKLKKNLITKLRETVDSAIKIFSVPYHHYSIDGDDFKITLYAKNEDGYFGAYFTYPVEILEMTDDEIREYLVSEYEKAVNKEVL